MATTVVLTDVVQSGEKVFIRFADGTELEFNSLADVQSWAQQADTDQDLTRQMVVAYADARAGGILGNINTVRDKSFIFDLSAQNPIRVQ